MKRNKLIATIMLVVTLFGTPATAEEQLMKEGSTENTKNQSKENFIQKLIHKFGNKEKKKSAENLVKETEEVMYDISANELLENYSYASVEVSEVQDNEERNNLLDRLDTIYAYYKKLNRAELNVKEAIEKCRQAPISIQSARDNIFSNLDTKSKYTNKLLKQLAETENSILKKKELEEEIEDINPYIFIETTIDSVEDNEEDSEAYWDNLYREFDDLEDSKDIGWKSENDKWYYLDSSGERETGWIWYNNHKYFLDDNGELKFGWFKQDNKWYYAYYNGDIAMNTIINGYELGEDGALITE